MKRVFEYIVTAVFLFLLFGGIVANILMEGEFKILGFITGFEISIILFIVTKTVFSWVEKTFKN